MALEARGASLTESEQLRQLGVDAVDAKAISDRAQAVIDSAAIASQPRRLRIPRRQPQAEPSTAEDIPPPPLQSSANFVRAPSSSSSSGSSKELRLLRSQEQEQSTRLQMISGGDFTFFSGQAHERKVSVVSRPRIVAPTHHTQSTSSSDSVLVPALEPVFQSPPIAPQTREVISLLDDSDSPPPITRLRTRSSNRSLKTDPDFDEESARESTSESDEPLSPRRKRRSAVVEDAEDDAVEEDTGDLECDDIADDVFWRRQRRFLRNRLQLEIEQLTAQPPSSATTSSIPPVLESTESAADGSHSRQSESNQTNPLGNDVSADVQFEGGLRCSSLLWNQLFGYQRTCLKWLWELITQGFGGIIADEMGSVLRWLLRRLNSSLITSVSARRSKPCRSSAVCIIPRDSCRAFHLMNLT